MPSKGIIIILLCVWSSYFSLIFLASQSNNSYKKQDIVQTKQLTAEEKAELDKWWREKIALPVMTTWGIDVNRLHSPHEALLSTFKAAGLKWSYVTKNKSNLGYTYYIRDDKRYLRYIICRQPDMFKSTRERLACSLLSRMRLLNLIDTTYPARQISWKEAKEWFDAAIYNSDNERWIYKGAYAR